MVFFCKFVVAFQQFYFNISFICPLTPTSGSATGPRWGLPFPRPLITSPGFPVPPYRRGPEEDKLTDPVWWRSMHAISINRGNRPTHKHTHTQTGPITIHCAAKLSAQCTGVMVHFRYCRKRSPYRLAWSRPCTDRDKIESTTVFHATTDLCHISSKSIDISENGSRKAFLAFIEDSHVNGWSMTVISASEDFAHSKYFQQLCNVSFKQTNF